RLRCDENNHNLVELTCVLISTPPGLRLLMASSCHCHYCRNNITGASVHFVCIHTYTNTQTYTITHIHTLHYAHSSYLNTHTHTLTHTHTSPLTHTHAQMGAAHTHTHTHTHTLCFYIHTSEGRQASP